MIVMAAAGNQVGFVTAPASYDNCIAVAATRRRRHAVAGVVTRRAPSTSPRPGRACGRPQFDWSTDAAAPARWSTQSHGTSYAVAHVAGVAALWIAKHGHANLVARFGRPNVQAAFLHLLRRPGVCRRPPGWDAPATAPGSSTPTRCCDAPLPAAVRRRRARAPAPAAPTTTRSPGSPRRPTRTRRQVAAVDRRAARPGRQRRRRPAAPVRGRAGLPGADRSDVADRARRPRRRTLAAPPALAGRVAAAGRPAHGSSSDRRAAASTRLTSRRRPPATTCSATTSVRLWVAPPARKNRRLTRPTTTTSPPGSTGRPAGRRVEPGDGHRRGAGVVAGGDVELAEHGCPTAAPEPSARRPACRAARRGCARSRRAPFHRAAGAGE